MVVVLLYSLVHDGLASYSGGSERFLTDVICYDVPFQVLSALIRDLVSILITSIRYQIRLNVGFNICHGVSAGTFRGHVVHVFLKT